MSRSKSSIWVFADYRNYFQNRVTLQLLAKANDLASDLGAEVCAVLFGHETDEYVAEYIAHGAHKVLAVEHSSLKQYSVEKYTVLMERLAREYNPEIILIGATSFGKEFAPRVAKRLGTGLTADCIGLKITADGNLLQIAPSFGGNLIAQIFFALTLWAALECYGQSLGLVQLIVINSLASFIGGVAPIPGGMGVMEAGLIAGFTAAGVPQEQAIAATFTARLFTSYLPPVWGWFALNWLRRRQYI